MKFYFIYYMVGRTYGRLRNQVTLVVVDYSRS